MISDGPILPSPVQLPLKPMGVTHILRTEFDTRLTGLDTDMNKNNLQFNLVIKLHWPPMPGYKQTANWGQKEILAL